MLPVSCSSYINLLKQISNLDSHFSGGTKVALPFHRAMDCADDSLYTEPILPQQVRVGAALRKCVRNPDPFHGNRPGLHHSFGHRAAETADDGMLFRGHNRAGLTGAALHRRSEE